MNTAVGDKPISSSFILDFTKSPRFYILTSPSLFLCSLTLLLCLKEVRNMGALWHMALALSFTLSGFIALLSSAEVIALFDEQKEGSVKRIGAIEDEYNEREKSGDKLREALQKELDQWKEEAKQRRIEKQSDERLLALLQSEVELMTEQKRSLIEELQGQKEGFAVVPVQPITQSQEDKKWYEGLYNQLKGQFEEKSALLSQTRKELFSTQTKLMALERQNIESRLDEKNELERDLAFQLKENEQYELEIKALEELISHIHQL